MIEQQKQALAALISAALSDLGINDVPVQLSRPKVAEHGDLACNVAMQCAKRLGKAPRAIAEDLVAAMRRRPECSQMLSDIQIAGPGFINLRFNNSAKFGVVAEVLRQGRGYGCNDSCKGQSVLLEYVSANPTGPLHLGHARQGALGDVLARVMRTQGYAVTREFYYNDAGVQIHNLAVSVQARAREELGLANAEEFPENGYRGDYIYDIARDYLAKKPVHTVTGSVVESHADANDLDAIRKYAVAYLRNEQDADMKALDVTMDNFYLESSLYTDGRVEAAVRAMTEAGCTYESDGALWLRTTDPRFAEFKDDKDRVMRKKDGYYTYFVPDVAYHLSKFERGFTRAIDIQGSDHHGTTARVRIGLQAAGTQMGFQIPKTFPEYLLHKMIRVMPRAPMSRCATWWTGSGAMPRASSWCPESPMPNSSLTLTSRSPRATRIRSTTCSTPMRASARCSRRQRKRATASRRPSRQLRSTSRLLRASTPQRWPTRWPNTATSSRLPRGILLRI